MMLLANYTHQMIIYSPSFLSCSPTSWLSCTSRICDTFPFICKRMPRLAIYRDMCVVKNARAYQTPTYTWHTSVLSSSSTWRPCRLYDCFAHTSELPVLRRMGMVARKEALSLALCVSIAAAHLVMCTSNYSSFYFSRKLCVRFFLQLFRLYAHQFVCVCVCIVQYVRNDVGCIVDAWEYCVHGKCALAGASERRIRAPCKSFNQMCARKCRRRRRHCCHRHCECIKLDIASLVHLYAVRTFVKQVKWNKLYVFF